ncbi:MAG: hypothetical protein JGK17_04050 [Microcoleus sp. PH2017_10_PVI_O_A]|uniref:hypothetical protein n=1 Tax=unclassified Microcoleus TaxID=2642155 RepID=UPI001D8F97A9|nr:MULTISPECIES: hypothetical protein [unclassified Microcoleus]TAE85345.1 MAG: hypothetical protein EAZ83_02940 [Oscillatoriales cyanobacterium]MCC3404759.1 hypothetical protein [Microcoleus sp. PH2017_10_PVI_O_A]MCC3458828.1 hypothetical protein [Microcoleus sp. PH2017_11_PCY_U_A]MCC3477025.1 hypothetical protein [Microcoleus sp. PH2017_12_PCY_D_A]MCC3527511.1 hypothetical protein [Microcoleus sp. PH2017_21_RUC_O_A]
MKTRFYKHKTQNLSIVLIASLIFIPLNTLSARAEKLRCFVDICIDPSSVKLSKSNFPGAPSYSVRTVLGTQQFSNEKMRVQMEVNCKQREFRTVRVSEDGENWSNFDPRWTLVDRNSSLSRMVDYSCKLAIE